MQCCYSVVKGKVPGEGELSQRLGGLKGAVSFQMGGSWSRRQGSAPKEGWDSGEKGQAPGWVERRTENGETIRQCRAL